MICTAVSVTNFARVWIKPREAIVRADDAYMLVGEELPAFTAQIDDLPVEADNLRKDELIVYDTPLTCTNDGTVAGVYPDVIVVTGVATQGNYAVTYVPGTLHVEERQRVTGLWIVDHADAGRGKVHLAFAPTLNGGTLTSDTIAGMSISVKCAATVSGLGDATPIAAELRDGTGTQDIGRGWVWITVDVPDGLDEAQSGVNLFWKVQVELKGGR